MALVTNRDAAVARVLAERERQEAKWGEQNPSFDRWLSILIEEIGETTAEMLHVSEWLAPSSHHMDVKRRNAYEAHQRARVEMVQVAAVALAMVEWFERGAPIHPSKIDHRLAKTHDWKVHNHGPDEGPGVACPQAQISGRLIGQCMLNDAANQIKQTTVHDAMHRDVHIPYGNEGYCSCGIYRCPEIATHPGTPHDRSLDLGG